MNLFILIPFLLDSLSPPILTQFPNISSLYLTLNPIFYCTQAQTIKTQSNEPQNKILTPLETTRLTWALTFFTTIVTPPVFLTIQNQEWSIQSLTKP